MKKQNIFVIVIVIVFAFIAVACNPTGAGPGEMKGPTTGPGAAIIASANAFNAGDLEKSLGYYVDDASVKLNGVPPGELDSYQGKEALRAWFKDLAQVHFQIQIEVLKVEGDTVTTKTQTWMDPTRALGVAPLVATEVYVVKDGKIKSETWTITPESAAKLQAAIIAATFPTGDFAAGPWVLELRPNGYLNAILEGKGMGGSTFTVTGDRVIFTSVADATCVSGQGSYTWSFDGNVLTFTLIEDSCENRRTVLTTGKWVKKP